MKAPIRFRYAARRGSPIGLSWSCATTLEQKQSSLEKILMHNASFHAMERRIVFGRSHAASATIMILGLLACRDAYPQAGGQFEEASVLVPAGNACILHPEGNSTQSIPVSADQDGVARFLAVRPILPGSLDRWALDCTDPNGSSHTYSVDLRSEETFAPRPFDPVLANLAFRPGLSRDPLSYTQQELLQGGYGLRPDPNQNPDGYQRWLAAASAPAYQLRSLRSAPSSSRPRPVHLASAPSTAPELDPTVAGTAPRLSPKVVNTRPWQPGSGARWSGAQMFGSYQKNATLAKTYSYIENEASWNVPSVTWGGFEWFSPTQMSIWNGLDWSKTIPPLLQAETWVYSFGPVASYSINHQGFGHVTCPTNAPNCTKPGDDNAAITFTPKAGDSIYAQEYYCDAKGNLNLRGGYACAWMQDVSQGLFWNCTQANSPNCQSYTLPAADLVNGALGQTAEFIIENDTGEIVGQSNSNEWPDFRSSPVTMTGSACVVQGSGVGCCGQGSCGKWVSTNTDPLVVLLTDNNWSNPPQRGDGHLRITLPSGGVKWSDVETNVYYWNGSSFNQFVPACATSIGVGPNSQGLTRGTAWITGCDPGADGNYDVYQLQSLYSPVGGTAQQGTFVKMQGDIATQVAVSPEGDAWAINAKGDIFYWDGISFFLNPWGGCARSIGVGPNSGGLTNGTPWIVGCNIAADGNSPVYRLDSSTGWVKMQGDVATQIAVSPEGHAWATKNNGDILYWNGRAFVSNQTGGCASSIGVGPNSRGLTHGTPWITGCTRAADANDSVLQMQTGGAWVDMQNDVGIQIAVSQAEAGSPENVAWVISLAKVNDQ